MSVNICNATGGVILIMARKLLIFMTKSFLKKSSGMWYRNHISIKELKRNA